MYCFTDVAKKCTDKLTGAERQGFVMSEKVELRLATAEDAKAILSIYEGYVQNTTISFEVEVPIVEEFQNRMEQIQAQFPWLVCEIDGIVAGYAYASKHAQRAAYRWSADLSVYIDEKYHRRHIAAALYAALLAVLRAQGYYTVYAGVSTPNPKSEAFHLAQGFTVVGVYPNVGYKLGKWCTLTWYGLTLQEYGEEPEEPRTLEEALTIEEIERILVKSAQMVSFAPKTV